MLICLAAECTATCESLHSSQLYLKRSIPDLAEDILRIPLPRLIRDELNLSSDSLSKYEDQQENIEGRYPGSAVKNNNLINFQISLIVFCVLVACIFGADVRPGYLSALHKFALTRDCCPPSSSFSLSTSSGGGRPGTEKV